MAPRSEPGTAAAGTLHGMTDEPGRVQTPEGPGPVTPEGPGPVTPDGCPVDVYLRLPAAGEPDLIDGAIPPQARILELGCGAGRLANVLAARGHRVTGVDESAEMLRHLRGVAAVPERIEDLRLGESFDVVLLPSNLLSTVPAETRRRFLDTCASHLAPGGMVLVQWFPPRVGGRPDRAPVDGRGVVQRHVGPRVEAGRVLPDGKDPVTGRDQRERLALS
jgi:SAM-dependent methyltransferase